MTTTRQRLRMLVKESSDLSNQIESEDYEPLLRKIARITEENVAIESDENNTLILKTGISRLTNSSFLNILETKRNLVFNDEELAKALFATIREEGQEDVEDEEAEVNWLKLSDSALSCFKSVFLPFPVQVSHENRTPEVEKVRQPRQKRSMADSKAIVAEKLARLEGEQNVRALESVYNDIIRSYLAEDRQPLPFYKLICDPESFTKSVHNAFQLSFLIQSNLVRVFKSEAGETLLEPLDTDAPFTSQKGGDNSIHAVITLDYDLWQATVSNYQINRSMING